MQTAFSTPPISPNHHQQRAILPPVRKGCKSGSVVGKSFVLLEFSVSTLIFLFLLGGWMVRSCSISSEAVIVSVFLKLVLPEVVLIQGMREYSMESNDGSSRLVVMSVANV